MLSKLHQSFVKDELHQIYSMACLLVLTDHDELSMVLTKISIQPVLDQNWVSVENEAITDNYSQTWLIGFPILGAVKYFDNINDLTMISTVGICEKGLTNNNKVETPNKGQ